MKKYLLIAGLAGAFAVGVSNVSVAQTSSAGGSGAGSVSGAKSDTTAGNPAHDGTGTGRSAGTDAGGASGGSAKGSPGIGKASRDTSEDRVPHN
jgi:hypothetical protein